jgi:pSer/pThr/pTyr-binding forkhead associated (FHA) protein
MMADLIRRPKVSLLFYSEEEGKRVMVDKWTIEVGKKYTIGRSKKKVDISIQDITISRIHSEFIFYDKDKIMIKDFNSSNGTFINKQRIEPNKENYFSIRDILSIGDEKKQLIFVIQNDIEEEPNIRNDFNNNITEKKIKNEEINQNKINKEQKDYYENEKIKNNKYYKKEKSKSFSSHNDSSSIEKDNYYEEKNKNYKYRRDKYRNDKDRDRDNDLDEKYEDDNYKNKRYRSRKESSPLSRSRSFSSKKSYKKRDVEYRRNKKNFSKKSENSDSYSEKSSKKNKHKNILSYIIKQEEEIEKENDKKQIRLYNEYLKIKEETDAKLEMNNLPNLLPVLTAKSEEEDDDVKEESSEEEIEVKKDVIILPRHLRRKMRTGIIKDFKIFNRRKNYIKRNGINRNYSNYRNRLGRKKSGN